MAKQRSDKSPYPSKYSPKGWITGQQYIIETVCEKKARKDNKELPIQFWKLPEWASFFKMQLRKARELIKKYSEKTIIRALDNPKARNTWSLHAPWLIPIIEEEHIKVLKENEALSKVVTHERVEPVVIPRKGKNSKLDMLKELE
jgi:hypothetical protein